MTDHPHPDPAPLDDDLGRRLSRLADTIAPSGIDLLADIRLALDSPPTPPTRSRRPMAIAAVVVLLAALIVVAIAPARTAVADWLGLGRTSVEIIDELPPAEPARPPSEPPRGEQADIESILAAARSQLGMEIALPDVSITGEPIGWEIRAIGQTRELVVAWRDLTMTARAAEFAEPIRKVVTPTAIVSSAVTTDGDPALWIEGLHVRVIGETPEEVGNTLLWIARAVEYRLSGSLDRDRAVAIASSLS
jgi:ABC-type cobalt transport system substrate-binding protein